MAAGCRLRADRQRMLGARRLLLVCVHPGRVRVRATGRALPRRFRVLRRQLVHRRCLRRRLPRGRPRLHDRRRLLLGVVPRRRVRRCEHGVHQPVQRVQHRRRVLHRPLLSQRWVHAWHLRVVLRSVLGQPSVLRRLHLQQRHVRAVHRRLVLRAERSELHERLAVLHRPHLRSVRPVQPVRRWESCLLRGYRLLRTRLLQRRHVLHASALQLHVCIGVLRSPVRPLLGDGRVLPR